MIRKSLLLMDELDEGGGISLELGNLFWKLSNIFSEDKNGLLQTWIFMIIHKYAILFTTSAAGVVFPRI